MVYRIVEKEPFKVFGTDFETSTINGECYTEIPKFCDELWNNGTHDRINVVAGNPQGHMLYGIHFDFKEDGSRRYMMGWDMPEGVIPREFKVLNVPLFTWAVFEGRGMMPDNLVIANVWKRIYSEWFPSSGFEQVEGPCIEKYFWMDEKKVDYTCEVWIPVKRKVHI